jgi:hypothetical protein
MLAAVLLASGSFYPIVNLFGYTYVHSTPSLIAMLLIIVVLTGKAMENRDEKTKGDVFLSAILPLIAIFNFVSTIYASGVVDYMPMYAVVYALFVLPCGLILFLAFVEAIAVRIILGIVYSILLIPILLMLLLIMFFTALERSSSPFPKITVVKSELSPNLIFLAEIVDGDAGAMGGSTSVRVTPLNSDINIFSGTLKKDQQLIYRGRWGEFETMTLRWEGDYTLYINEKQYVVK